MTWADVLKVAGSVAGLLVIVAGALLPAMDERLRRKFASRDDVNGMRVRLEEDIQRNRDAAHRTGNLFVALDDRVGDLEEKTAVLQERQGQQFERISEQIANTARSIDRATERIERVTEMQQGLQLEIERIHRSLKE